MNQNNNFPLNFQGDDGYKAKYEALLSEVSRINGMLDEKGFERLPDLFDDSLDNKNSLLELIKTIIHTLSRSYFEKHGVNQKLSQALSEKRSIESALSSQKAKRKIQEAEIRSLKFQIRSMDDKIRSQKTRFNKERFSIEKEVSTFKGKEKQYQTDLRKKDNTIKNLQDRLHDLQTKHLKASGAYSSKVRINSLEITNGALRKGPGFYSDAANDFMKMTQKAEKVTFKRLKTENSVLREAMKEYQSMIDEIVKLRKIQFERNNPQSENLQDNVFIQLKSELFDLQAEPMSETTLKYLRENILKFKNFLNEMDRIRGFSVAGGREELEETGMLNSAEVQQADIETIKNAKKLEDVLGGYKTIVATQDNLLMLTMSKINNQRPKAKDLASRYSLLNSVGLDQAKKFLEEQRKVIKKFKSEYESAKKMAFQTHQKIEEEMSHVKERRSIMQVNSELGLRGGEVSQSQSHFNNVDNNAPTFSGIDRMMGSSALQPAGASDQSEKFIY